MNPYFAPIAMLAKITAKNQLTLPKSVTQAVGATEYFDVEARAGQIILTPVRIQRGDAVRAKLAELELTDADLADAVAWARAPQSAPAAGTPPRAYNMLRASAMATLRRARPRGTPLAAPGRDRGHPPPTRRPAMNRREAQKRLGLARRVPKIDVLGHRQFIHQHKRCT